MSVSQLFPIYSLFKEKWEKITTFSVFSFKRTRKTHVVNHINCNGITWYYLESISELPLDPAYQSYQGYLIYPRRETLKHEVNQSFLVLSFSLKFSNTLQTYVLDLHLFQTLNSAQSIVNLTSLVYTLHHQHHLFTLYTTNITGLHFTPSI